MTPSDIPQRMQRVKAAVPLMPFLERSGFKLRRVGAGKWIMLCPFHDEKTPSFNVDENRHHYHCFGCGQQGDLIDFVMASRSITNIEALELMEAVGCMPIYANHTPPKPAAPEPDKPLEPMPENRFGAWQAACENLLNNSREIDRLATWRGFSPETLRGAAASHLMGTWGYFGEPREAFLVQAPAAFFPSAIACTHCSSTGRQSAEDFTEGATQNCQHCNREGRLHASLLPHAIHCRLGPHTPGNKHAKQSWRYDPSGSKSWPFIWGNPFGARWLFILEGQWDALALADLCAWHSPASMPPHTCIIGLRGATSWKLLLHPQHGLPLDPDATAIAIGDADVAGAKWYEPGGFIPTLRTRVKRLITYRPTHPGCKDFNDLTKGHHITAEQFLTWVKSRLRRHPWQRPGPTHTFFQFCQAQAKGEGDTAAAARLIITDPQHPRGRRKSSIYRSYWRTLKLPESDLTFRHELLDLWQNPPPPQK